MDDQESNAPENILRVRVFKYPMRIDKKPQFMIVNKLP
ncbi:hypothetical protein RINTHM_12950 [Richelia intracellularis HM01]|nr:hypothetical protein RINTHM_12950 [Richelia intracellularis HM01]